MWTLFPLLLLVGAARYGRAVLFCGLVFGTAFLAHSLAAWKAERYLMYAYPFFFAGVGLGAAEVLRWAVPRVRDWIGSRTASPLIPARGANVIAMGVMAAALLFAVGGNGAASYSVRMMLTPDGEWHLHQPYRGESDWAAVAEFLGSEVDDYEVILASSELKSTYFLGRIDYDLVPELIATRGAIADSVSFKTETPWVLDANALDEAVRCHESGLVLIERGHWHEPIGVHEPFTSHLMETTEPIEVPEAWRLRLFRWRHASFERPATCT
jgi:hypothetical protein